MKATAFEVRYAALLRLCLIVAAFGMYLADPDDVVWRFIRAFSSRPALEHAAFLLATLLIAAGALVATCAQALKPSADSARDPRAPDRMELIGDLLYAIGLATLAPLWGAVLLITGESALILRLMLAQSERNQSVKATCRETPVVRWRYAFRKQAAKWGVFLTMIAFTVTLIDRVADFGVLASAIVWLALNWPEIKSKYCPSAVASA